VSGNFRVLDQERTDRAIEGVDYGRKVLILARAEGKLLLWVPGQSAWNGTGQPWRYEPSRLMIHVGGGSRYHRLSSGGRLVSRLRDPDVGRLIDEHFGDGFHKLLDPKTTVEIGGQS
jgi:hypothetical protein